MNSLVHCDVQEIARKLGSESYHFVGLASFEERAFGIWRGIHGGISGRRIICFNENHRSYLERNLEQFRNDDPGVEVVSLDSDNPVTTFESLREMVDTLAVDGPCRIVVDVTGFTREAVAMLLYICRHRLPHGSTVRIAYQKARAYGQSRSGGWLSQGVREVRTVLGYAGLVRFGAETHLFLLAGFEFERAQQIVEAVQPAKISLGWVAGASSVSPDLNDQLDIFLRRIEALYAGPTFDRFEFSSVDPFSTRDCILARKEKTRGNVVVACMNTKVSMIGVCLAALEDPTLQLVYAQPIAYNTREYSTPSGSAVLFTIPI